jgi:hypothetical protein
MKSRFLIGTALSLVFTATALAQSPSGSTTTAPTTQTQTPSTSAPVVQKTPDRHVIQSDAFKFFLHDRPGSVYQLVAGADNGSCFVTTKRNVRASAGPKQHRCTCE